MKEKIENKEPLKANDSADKTKTSLPQEENMKILQYPVYFRGALIKADLIGELIEEAYRKLEIFDYMS
jgi:hypothetical protein